MVNQLKDDRSKPAEIAGDDASMTIDEFCTSQRISRAHFYVMQREGWGPRVMYLGASVRISPEARRDWRREREVAAAAGIRRGKNSENRSPDDRRLGRARGAERVKKPGTAS
jgi:hypothetical protein